MGRERRALYEREKKKDERRGGGLLGTGKRDEEGVCVEI